MAIDEDSNGQRLDNFLIRQLKGVPKTHIYRLIRSGQVRVNKARASADTRLLSGDVVRIPPVRVAERSISPSISAVPVAQFKVVFEDDALLVIDKPAGVAVHGGSGVSFGVIEQLRRSRPDAKFLELIHRLDRETSGLLMIAKKRSALKHLQDQLRERETGKTYLALVSGRWPLNKKVLDKPLHKYLLGDDEGSERRVKVVSKDDSNGMRAITLVQVRRRSAPTTPTKAPKTAMLPVTEPQGFEQGFSLLEVTIKTGRTHQIRVHLSSEGYPIAGDDKYGDFGLNKALASLKADLSKPAMAPLKRMFLHAWRLQFTHPISAERMELHAQLPEELQHFLSFALPSEFRTP
ncbi:MAG: RluA family pseudouridine synthase [Betaproteobacteria bacterium]|nr:RluA family pseudouridine synthase [Betaproteobacteria bacterium]